MPNWRLVTTTTGRTGPAWSWLHNVIVPAMLAVAEAGWASLLFGAAYNGPRGPAVHLPFLALAVPATVAVVVASWGGRLAGRVFGRVTVSRRSGLGGSESRRRGRFARAWRTTRWRSPVFVMVAVVVIAMALTAGVISELTVPGSFVRVAVQPWSSVGHVRAVVAGASWFVSIVVWLRGAWLGRSALTLRHAVTSMTVAGAAFLGIFAGRAAHHSAEFGAASRAAGWLFFISFPLTAAVIALVHQRDLEREVLARASNRPSRTWVAVLAVPMAGVALVSLLLAAVVGPVAPLIGRAIASAASAIGSALEAAVQWLWDLLPKGRPRQLPPLHRRVGAGGRLPIHLHPSNSTRFTIPNWVGYVIIAVVVGAIAFYLLRRVHLPRLARATEADASEERDSLFTWRHLFEQLLSRLRGLASRLRPRRRRRPPSRSPVEPRAAEVVVALDPRSVREVYRGLLVAAREGGAPRCATETSHELARRFTSRLELGDEAAEHLFHLTGLYEAVRYGGASDADHHEASLDAGVVIPALQAALAPATSDTATSGGLGDSTSGSA